MVPDGFVDRLKTLTAHFVHTEPASIFALFTWEQTNLAELYLFLINGFSICQCAERDHEFSFLFLNLSAVPKKSTSGKSAYI